MFMLVIKSNVFFPSQVNESLIMIEKFRNPTQFNMYMIKDDEKYTSSIDKNRNH